MNPEKNCLAEMMLLIENGVLVRNTRDDDDFMKFAKDSIWLTSVLKKAETLLGRASQ